MPPKKPDMTREFTTPAFWDCECETDYIHPKKRQPVCNVCGAHLLDENGDDWMWSDSHTTEVAEMLGVEIQDVPYYAYRYNWKHR